MMTANFLEFTENWQRPKREAHRDFYPLVPKTLRENLEFRREAVELGNSDPEYAAELWIMCKRDILFFANTFLWAKEPRGRSASKYKVFPWITWPIQDWWLTEAEASYGIEHVFTPKSREVGLTIAVMALVLHRMLFFEDEDLGVASRNEEKVDKLDDPSSMFGKIDGFMKYLPKFLTGDKGVDWERGSSRFTTPAQSCTLMGYPATAELNRGGRNTMFGLDEPAAFGKRDDWRAKESLVSVTDSWFMWGTLSRDDTRMFNQVIDDVAVPGKRLKFPWWHCPPMRAGLYTNDEHGKFKPLDPGYEYPADFKPIIDASKPGYLRSPWFDVKTAGMTPAAIAREFNIDRSGGRGQVYDPIALRELSAKCEPPTCTGRLVYEVGSEDDDRFDVTPKFEVDPDGPWKLWFEPIGGKVPAGVIVATGNDISGGTGASSSTIGVMDRTTRRQVAAFASSSMSPKRFAKESIAACLWFGETADAYMVPESNGGMTGQSFLKEVKRLGYEHLVHVNRNTDGRRDKKTNKLGLWTPHSGPGVWLDELLRAALCGQCRVLDVDTWIELGQYQWDSGNPKHPGKSTGAEDESDSDKNHGDKAVAAALMWYGASLKPYKPEEKKKAEPAYGSADWLDRYLADAERSQQTSDEYNFA